MSKVAVIAKLVAKEGQRDALVRALDQGMANAAGEEGTLMYILNADVKSPEVLWFYELYRDQDARVAHGTSDGMKALGPVLAPFLTGRPEIIELQPLGRKGLVS
jgi:quinol monooxygenase YgiN